MEFRLQEPHYQCVHSFYLVCMEAIYFLLFQQSFWESDTLVFIYVTIKEYLKVRRRAGCRWPEKVCVFAGYSQCNMICRDKTLYRNPVLEVL